MEARDAGRRVRALPSQTPGLRARYGLTRDQTDRELWAIDARGAHFSAAAAVNQVLAELHWPWSWVANAYRVAPARWLEDRVYRWVADHRGHLWFWTTTPECQRPGSACE